jgi:hypothetical protein
LSITIGRLAQSRRRIAEAVIRITAMVMSLEVEMMGTGRILSTAK